VKKPTGLSETMPPDPEKKFAERSFHETIQTHVGFGEMKKGLMKLGYKITAQIGKGGMGTVYEGIQQDTKKKVAIKILQDSLIDRPDERTRFLREAELIRRIRHPGVVEIHESGEMNGRPFFVMEYLSGKNLADVISKNNGLPHVQALQIVYDVCEALRAAHNAGIMHRDIKPANIFILRKDRDEQDKDSSKIVKVIDLGLARFTNIDVTHGLTKTGAVLGTPHYVAPEMFSGEKYDHRVDIYSLGIVLYEAICGKLPFESNNVYGLIFKHKEEIPELMGKRRPELVIPEKVEKLVQKAMAKKPEDRFQNMEEMMKALEDCGVKPKARVEIRLKMPRVRRVALPLALAAAAAFAGVYHRENIRSYLAPKPKEQIMQKKADRKAPEKVQPQVYLATVKTDIPGVSVFEETKLESGTVVSRELGKTPAELYLIGERTVFLQSDGYQRAYYKITPRDASVDHKMKKR